MNQSYEEVTSGIKACMYPGYPELCMQLNEKVKFVYEPYWYNGIEYPKEQERGYPYREDLYVPGYFEVPIKKGETIIFSAGDSAVATVRLKALYENKVVARTPRTSFFNCLKNSAQQFYFRPKEDDAYLLAGYPWFKVRAKDLLAALPGNTLPINDSIRFEKIMHTAMLATRAYVGNGRSDAVIREIEYPDVLLQAIWAIQQYAKHEGVEKTCEPHDDFVKEVTDYIRDQKHPDMKLMKNGLLFANGKDKAVTWMSSIVNGKPVVIRSGYTVKFNALWYNALCFYTELMGGAPVEGIDLIIKSMDKSFSETFVNRYNCLFDSVNGSTVDWSVRSSMIFAVTLPYSPLTRMQKHAVVDIVTKELLTPKSLHSLSPKSEGYRPYYMGPQYERDLAYHQGTAWPWLLGACLEACLRVFGKSGVVFAERILIGLEEEMSLHCIGTIPELFDSNPPLTGRGAVSFAMNVAAILRVVDLLKKYNVE